MTFLDGVAYASTDNQIWITDGKSRIDTIVPHKPDVVNVEVIDYIAGTAAHYQVCSPLAVQLLSHTRSDGQMGGVCILQ